MKDYEVEVKGSDGKNYIRTRCDIYTRVMGYIRPVSGYNLGKKSEYYGKKFFTEDKINNSEFLRKYSVAKQ